MITVEEGDVTRIAKTGQEFIDQLYFGLLQDNGSFPKSDFRGGLGKACRFCLSAT